MKKIDALKLSPAQEDFQGVLGNVRLTPSELLLSAAGKGDRRNIIYALEKGADATKRGSGQATALHYICAMGWGRELIKPLLDAGADLNAVDMQGRTALHEASLGGWKNTVETLLAYGADVHIKDNRGRTASDIAKIQLQRVHEEEQNRRRMLEKARTR